MGHLGYRSLKTLRVLSNGMDFKETASKELCKNCQKGNQTCQPSKIAISQFTKFLGWVNNDLEVQFSGQNKAVDTTSFFLEKSTGFIDIKLLRYKDDTLIAFQDYKALCEK